ncbi:ferritin-4, chloroplastic-like protein [Tanacetum coccineum]|uniref:Ferritin n=1 Tax=Tanacetum coccineum TaxID=301880 RepID=A0ABQ5C9S1_9ASTR
MLLRVPQALSFPTGSDGVKTTTHAPARVMCASVKSSNNAAISGVVFEPFEEVKKELNLIPSAPHQSIARHKYAADSESCINEQIKFFKESSEEEREHAEKFMEYQNKRGGKVKLQSIIMPLSEFDHEEKGDALYAMELALSLEKLTNEKLLNLHEVASRNNDVQLADFVESEFLGEQVEAIKKISEYVLLRLKESAKVHVFGTLIRCSSIKVLLLDGGKFSYFSIDIVSRGWLLVVDASIKAMKEESDAKFEELKQLILGTSTHVDVPQTTKVQRFQTGNEEEFAATVDRENATHDGNKPNWRKSLNHAMELAVSIEDNQLFEGVMCEEKYTPGHRCTSRTLQVMLVDESDEVEEPDLNFKSWDRGSKIED